MSENFDFSRNLEESKAANASNEEIKTTTASAQASETTKDGSDGFFDTFSNAG
jgi:hypothetical protein